MQRCQVNKNKDIDLRTLTCSQVMALMLLIEAQKKNEPIQLIVHGTAGTGKTHLIRTIKQTCTGVLCMAPTGMAAQLIGGVTYQSSIPVPVRNQRTWPKLPTTVLARYQEKLKDYDVLVLDEFSMLSCLANGWLDKRLREIRDPSKPYGGFKIVFSGDFGQLPPCGGMGEGGEQGRTCVV